MLTGQAERDEVCNHVLPAWDLVTGEMAVIGILTAERRRSKTGEGQHVKLALEDAALAVMGHLGFVAEAQLGTRRERIGNDLFGAFGRDFRTRDGHRLMVVAITRRQWSGLVGACNLAAEVAALERELGVSFGADEGLRFVHRDRLNALFEAAFAGMTEAELQPAFDAEGVCWGPYQTLRQAAQDDPRFSAANPLLASTEHASGTYLTPGAAASLSGAARGAPGPAPRLGQHTDEVLAEFLGLPGHEIARLHDLGLVAGARGAA
jgi:2-methylfumaryl-CoA isomerase